MLLYNATLQITIYIIKFFQISYIIAIVHLY